MIRFTFAQNTLVNIQRLPQKPLVMCAMTNMIGHELMNVCMDRDS